MNYKLVFSPELEINPSEFVSEWNEWVTSRNIANAEIATENETMRGFGPVGDIAITQVIIPISVSIAANFIYDAIKKILNKQKPGIQIQVKPHNGEILLVTPMN